MIWSPSKIQAMSTIRLILHAWCYDTSYLRYTRCQGATGWHAVSTSVGSGRSSYDHQCTKLLCQSTWANYCKLLCQATSAFENHRIAISYCTGTCMICDILQVIHALQWYDTWVAVICDKRYLHCSDTQISHHRKCRLAWHGYGLVSSQSDSSQICLCPDQRCICVDSNKTFTFSNNEKQRG